LFPSISTVLAYSRTLASAEALAAEARRRGLEGAAVEQPAALVADADIVISMVPAAPGLQPFLDASAMKAQSLALMVDVGRSWLPAKLGAFDRFSTDSMTQLRHPLDARGDKVKSVTVGFDLDTGLPPAGGRQAFV